MRSRFGAVVLFGATGDLVKKKIVPALTLLQEAGKIGNDIVVVGVGRRDDAPAVFPAHGWAYVGGDPSSPVVLRSGISEKYRLGKSILWYLALPPVAYEGVLSALLSVVQNGDRVCLEKPFGTSLAHVERLVLLGDQLLKMGVDVIPVDHFLYKSEIVTTATWLADHGYFGRDLVSVSAKYYGKRPVEERTDFYDQVGAFDDVMSNHLVLTISDLLAHMSEKEGVMSDRRQKIVESMLIDRPGAWRKAQYEGYREHPGVLPESVRETWVRGEMVVHFQGRSLPVVLETGKGMPDSRFTILCEFSHGEVLAEIQPTFQVVVGGVTHSMENPRRAYQELFDSLLYSEDDSRRLTLAGALSLMTVTEPMREHLSTVKLESYRVGGMIR